MPRILRNPRVQRWRAAAGCVLAVPICACAVFEIHRKTDHLQPAKQLSAPHWRLRDDVDAARYARPYDSLRDELRGVKSVGFVPARPTFEGERYIAQSTHCQSFSVIDGMLTCVLGRLIPLAVLSTPPDVHVAASWL